MKCMNCGLINHETAERCDCGYDFATQVVKASYLLVQQMPLRKRWNFLLISPAYFFALGPPIGVFSSVLIQTMVMEGTSSVTVRDLGVLVALVPVAYGIGAIPALITGIVYGMVSLMLPHKLLRNFLWRAILGGMIGTVSTQVYCVFGGLNTDLALWAGLPAGAICSLLPQSQPPDPPLPPTAEKSAG